MTDDFKFAETNVKGNPVAYGTAGDCFSSNLSSECRKGSFMIDLTGTGLKVNHHTSWEVIPSIPGIKIEDFQNKNYSKLSAKCGGRCAHCQPVGDLKLELQQCLFRKGISFDATMISLFPLVSTSFFFSCDHDPIQNILPVFDFQFDVYSSSYKKI